MKKNLNVTAAVLDLRKVSEETFASYEDIKLQAALVLTTPRSRLCWQSIRWRWRRRSPSPAVRIRRSAL